MEKKNNLKEDHEETKMSLGDVENGNPVSEMPCATGPLRAVVEERTVSFKLGDLEEAPERERLPMDLKEETSIDGTISGEFPSRGFLVPCLWRGCYSGLMHFALNVSLLISARCSAVA